MPCSSWLPILFTLYCTQSHFEDEKKNKTKKEERKSQYYTANAERIYDEKNKSPGGASFLLFPLVFRALRANFSVEER